MRGLARPFLLFAMLFLVFASRARAWTDATVRTGTAEITLEGDGYASVTMRARIRVNGGWLEGFDIEGLDQDALFDPSQPPVFTDESGIARPMEFTPRPGGRVQLRFRRASAPHRGEYEITLHYRTHLDGLVHEQEDGSLEVSWVFPAWRYGLDDVEVTWVTPRETRAADPDMEASPIDIATSSSEAGVRIVYRRPHLPRTSEWTTRVHLAADAWPYVQAQAAAPAALEASADPASVAVVAETSADTQPSSSGDLEPHASARLQSPTWHGSLLLACIALGAFLKRRGLALRARLVPALRAIPLLPLPSWGRNSLVLATLVVASLACFLPVPLEVELALGVLCAALGWQRVEPAVGEPRMAQLQAIAPGMQRTARQDSWRVFLAWDAALDPARLGLPASGALLAFAAFEGDSFVRALAACFFALVMGSSTRALGHPFEAVRRASPLVEAWRRAGFESQLVGRVSMRYPRVPGHVAARAPADDVRVRVALRSGASLEVQVDGTTRLLFSDASGLQLKVLQQWCDEQGEQFDEVRRAAEFSACTPSQGSALDALLTRAAADEANEATLQDTSDARDLLAAE